MGSVRSGPNCSGGSEKTKQGMKIAFVRGLGAAHFRRRERERERDGMREGGGWRVEGERKREGDKGSLSSLLNSQLLDR